MPSAGTAAHAPSDTLFTRTYVGLLAAQFLAAFNDQAIHASAMFFAINTGTLSEAQAISLMPILFYAPWALFCTLAGYLADRFSKRATLVFWKVAEIGICLAAVGGFWLGTDGGSPSAGAWVVLSTVFLMGTHSAFFVPAKYGVMPEILQPQLLSRGNGLLESLSFLAVILGTVSGGVLSFVFLRREVNIGLVLLGLAVVGAVASLMIRRMPAANPTLRFPPYLYGPLVKNLRLLLSSRPLSFAVIGIAFFTFIVAFMRAAVYMFGESQNPRWDELKTSAVVGTVALGVGLGSPLAGYLSGKKVELGLIPLGALGMMIGCVVAGFSLGYVPGFIACTILIGVCTGFYLVPLFTLLQYRAPKSSKGDMVASSNFINVTGAIAASVLFAVLVWTAKWTGFVPRVAMQDQVAAGELDELELLHGRPAYIRVGDWEAGRRPTERDQELHLFDQLFGDPPTDVPPEIHIDRSVTVGKKVRVVPFQIGSVRHYDVSPFLNKMAPEHYDAQRLPQFLFVGAGLMTFGVLIVLWRRVRDLPGRTQTLLASLLRRPMHLDGLAQVPGDGPTLLLVETADPWALQLIRSAIDRFVLVVEPTTQQSHREEAERVLNRGDVVAVLMHGPAAADWVRQWEAVRIRVTSHDGVLLFQPEKTA